MIKEKANFKTSDNLANNENYFFNYQQNPRQRVETCTVSRFTDTDLDTERCPI